ncbi:MAG TPA: alkaline phytoceramidase [Methylomirabilota bacterium]|nr:alkaline phytoceramidase [Methylomirabilota bacterium]
MTRQGRVAAVVGLAVVCVLAALLLPPVAQDPAYHRFADTRPVWGVSNGLNVLSNLSFVLVGLAGLILLALPAGPCRFIERREAWPYAALFGGLVLTGAGSAWYHLAPDNERLVWDRLPLAVTVMAFFGATIMERIGVRAGLALLVPLLGLGVASVLQWHWSELRGQGDLRLYGLVQFFPVLAIPVLYLLFPPRYTGGAVVVAVLGVYGLARAFEWGDAAIFALGRVASGHTLKHVAMALAGGGILWMLLIRRTA